MTALAADSVRAFPETNFNRFFDYGVKGTTKVYEGGALGKDANGFVRPLASGDAFVGFAMRLADNTAGADGAIKVRVRTHGHVRLVISGATIANLGDPVWAQTDNDFVLTRTADDAHVGFVTDVETGAACIIEFEAKEPDAKIADPTDLATSITAITALINACEKAGVIFPAA